MFKLVALQSPEQEEFTESKEMLNHFVLALFISLSLAVLVDAQDQSEFISLDCGLPRDSNYNDSTTGINYVSDAAFIETGTGMTLSKEFDTVNLQQLWHVRSFPDQDIRRNCYNLKLKSETKYLIRATFMYGNYDPQGKLPIQFDFHLGANLWDTVRLDDPSSVVTKEIIHVSSMDYIYVCLVNTGFGTPFISALEFRPLNNSIYVAESGSLVLFARWDVASTTNETVVRYPNDVYDRIWMPNNSDGWAKPNDVNSTSASFDGYGLFQPPSTVMRTAATPANASEPLLLSFYTANPISQFYVFMHFAEPYRNLQVNRTREFKVFLNGVPWYTSSLVLVYGEPITIYSTTPLDRGRNQFSINRTENSTLPPILNAIEAYTERNFLQSQTEQNDGIFYDLTNRAKSIKSTYRLMKGNWQGDPCVPQAYLWNGLNCSYNGYAPPRIVSLNLSSSGLTGNITPSLINLRSMQYLDLSDNHLNGSVPEFLAKMPSLRVLNLDGNNLTGSIPVELIERSNNESLMLRVLGKGGFGIVYHGYLDDTEVAVKMISASSSQGYKEFHAEVNLLMRVHHRNLTNLVGYCKEGSIMGLVYEYMVNGNLQQHLSDKNAIILSWENRLRIAVDAAQGLEYLHHGCKPSIIHRDIKSTNILLNENFEAKLADFGLSRMFLTESDTHVSTVVAGTPGYLDPDLGIVLVEIITSQPVIRKKENEITHIIEWVNETLAKRNNIECVADPGLIEGDFGILCVRKAVELALTCASHAPSKRPTMNEAVMRLKECLAMELDRKDQIGRDSEPDQSPYSFQNDH
ncbi:hypothetical protein JRO89_XS09G0195200 [Xanthoceras sorbifolium]|uniref:non-specific serine/threonine protein kinase n=1 Tax=Xanthoceras sorbifolium TaxID=99658 RepID=A0ABQ8HLY6_9ROSI|nr:hypothetical protein JRO89_XS09G0195200 [Xanthoceras sorbifolium]